MRVNTTLAAIALNNTPGAANSSGNLLPKVVPQVQGASPDTERAGTRAIITKPTYNRNQQRTLYTKGRFVDSYV